MWVLALVGFALVAAGTEWAWRAKGYLPSVSDRELYWAHARNRVYARGGEKKIVILGGSRAQVGIDPAVLRDALPGAHPAVHLAMDGKAPFAVLRDLAKDPRFDGIVLCDVTTAGLTSFAFEQAESRVRFYHDEYHRARRWEDRLNMMFHVWLESRLVICAARLRLFRQVVDREGLQPSYQHMRADRYRAAQYLTRMSAERLEEHRADRLRKSAGYRGHDWLKKRERFERELVEHVKPLVAALQARGGEVIFLRMPTSGELWDISTGEWPKEPYWDKVAPLTGARTIHFKDHADLAAFRCPDGSHLDASDAPAFTRALAGHLAPLLP